MSGRANNSVTLTFAGDTTSLDRATKAASADVDSVSKSLADNAKHAQEAGSQLGALGEKVEGSTKNIRGGKDAIDGVATSLGAMGVAIPGPVGNILSMGQGLADMADGIGGTVIPALEKMLTKMGLMTTATEANTVADEANTVATEEMATAQLTGVGTALKYAGAIGIVAGALFLLKDKLHDAGTALGNWLEPLKAGTIDTEAADKQIVALADAFDKAGIGAIYAGAAQQAIFDANRKTGGSVADLIDRLEKLGLTNNEVIATLTGMGISAGDAAAAVNRMDFAGAEARLAHLQAAAELAANGIYLAAQAAAAFSQFPTAANANAHKGIATTLGGGDPALANFVPDFSTPAIKKLSAGGGAAAKVAKLTGKSLIDAFVDGMAGSQSKLDAAMASVTGTVKDQFQALAGLVAQARQIATSIASAFAPKLSAANENGSVLDQLAKQLDQTQALQRDIVLLQKEGLSKGLLSQLAAGGVGSLDVANQLALGGQGAVNQANSLASAISKAGGSIGADEAQRTTNVTLSANLQTVLKVDGKTLADVVQKELLKKKKTSGSLGLS